MRRRNGLSRRKLTKFQNKLIRQKKKNKLSNAEIARRVGCSRQWVWSLLNQPITNPSISTLKGLAAAFGCSEKELAD